MCCISSPPLIGRISAPPCDGGSATRIRMFFLPWSTATAPSSYAGATITSVKISATCSAIATETGTLVAITPPNADTGSHSCARRCASATSAPTAIPHGLACLMIATVGWSPWSYAARRAASVST